MPPLVDTILDVVLWRSQKKMSRINARRVIAMMANEEPFGDRAPK
jgi:hypothetical protein